MANYPYTSNTPLASQNPSDTQSDIQQNFASINSLIDEDHVGFGKDNGGFHNQTRMPQQAGIPGGTINNSVNSFVNNVSGTSQEFKTLGTSTNKYQNTNFIESEFGTFGQLPGWSYLPGGLVIQYGLSGSISATSNETVNFNFSFSSAPYVTLGLLANTDSQKFVHIKSVTVSDFVVRNSLGGSSVRVYWIAIGQAS